jgi:hypothetical protein
MKLLTSVFLYREDRCFFQDNWYPAETDCDFRFITNWTGGRINEDLES